MIDKNGRLFGKVSIIDIFVLIIIVGVALATVYRFSPGNIFKTTDKTVTYTINVDGLRGFTYQYYHVGDQCFDQKTGQNIGKIKSVRQEPSFEEAILADGTVVLAEKPNVISIYVDIQANGTQNRTSYFANGTYEIKVGSEIHMNTKYIDALGVVYDVSMD